MRLQKIILENYRGYQSATTVEFNDLTAFIGKNDAGKSSILDALNTFFNEKEYELTVDDFCKIEHLCKQCKISCVFSDFPQKIIIDETAETDLANEYLLNQDGLLEIQKVWEISSGRLKSSVFCHAFHPSHNKLSDLLQLTNSQLKTRAKELKITDVNLNINKEIRSAIRKSFPNSDWNLQNTYIRIDDKNLKDCWEKIQKYMPLYALFKSDRPSTDADQEAQDPMMTAVDMALKEIQEDLDRIIQGISDKLKDVTTRTLEEIRKISPELANELKPVLPNKEKIKWRSLFKPSIQCENNIPINKKGSGTRRLILMSFFKAELNRRQELHEKTNAEDVIFAIEEPETSQHPNNVLMILNVLKNLAETENTQVILTTHVPALAKQLNIEDIRFVQKRDAFPIIKSVKNDEEHFLTDVAESLDISSFYSTIQKVKLLLYFEGPNDIILMKNLSCILHEANNIYADLNLDSVALIPLGGSSLKQWVDNDYLKNLDIPQIFVFDGDKTDYIDKANRINNENNPKKIAFTSQPYKTFENILSIEKIKQAISSKHSEIKDFSSFQITQNDDVSSTIAKFVYEYNGANQFDSLDEDKKKVKISTIKKWLNRDVPTQMTATEIINNDSDKILLKVLGTVSNYLNDDYTVYIPK